MSPKLPADWREMKLGDVYDIAAGGDLNVAEYSQKPDEFYPFPVYSNALKNKGLYGYSKRAKYDEDAITITARGDIGSANHRKTKFVAIGRLLVLKKRIPIFNEFVCEYINYKVRFSKEITGVPQLTAPQASNYRVVIPPLPEQKAISDILQKWDEAIEKTEALISAKQKQFEWLLKRLISDQQGGPGWRDIKLGEVGKIHSGGTPSTKEQANWGGDIFWLTPTEVTKLPGKFIFSTDRTITKRALSQTTLLPPNCLIVCTRATLGECCINKVPMAINQGFKCIEPYDEFDVIFLYYAMQISSGKLLRLASGNTFGEVSKKDFANIVLTLPSLSEQKAIAHILNTAQREIGFLKQLADRYRTQKRGLMQKLLTGEWRV